jgi:hypothetical protein
MIRFANKTLPQQNISDVSAKRDDCHFYSEDEGSRLLQTTWRHLQEGGTLQLQL